MDTVATYTDEQSLRLAQEMLRKLGIPHSTQPVEGEIPQMAVRVPEEHYERACHAVETLDGLLLEQTQENRKPQLCRACGSGDLRRLDDFDPEDSVTGIALLYKCMKCGSPNTG